MPRNVPQNCQEISKYQRKERNCMPHLQEQSCNKHLCLLRLLLLFLQMKTKTDRLEDKVVPL